MRRHLEHALCMSRMNIKGVVLCVKDRFETMMWMCVRVCRRSSPELGGRMANAYICEHIKYNWNFRHVLRC